MARVITFSRVYPAYHHKAGQPTYFVEKVVNSLLPISKAEELMAYYYENMPDDIQIDSLAGFLPKHHTIRKGSRWKKGDYFSPRIWTGRPYASQQLAFAPDVKIKNVWDFEIRCKLPKRYYLLINKKEILIGDPKLPLSISASKKLKKLAQNDGLSVSDLLDWFQYPKESGKMQIICWDSNVKY